MKLRCPICGLWVKPSPDAILCSRCRAKLEEIEPEWRPPRINEDSKLYKSLATMKELGGLACQLVIAAIVLNFVAVVATGNYLFRIELRMAVFLFVTGLAVGSIGYFGVEEMDDHECDTLREWVSAHRSTFGGAAIGGLFYVMIVARLW